METDPKLLEILVCPLTKTTLVYDRDRQELISRAAGLAYHIRDGVPEISILVTGSQQVSACSLLEIIVIIVSFDPSGLAPVICSRYSVPSAASS